MEKTLGVDRHQAMESILKKTDYMRLIRDIPHKNVTDANEIFLQTACKLAVCVNPSIV